MKKRNIVLILFTIIGFIGNAQVKDISVTISPAAEYTWWDNHSGLKDGMLVGGKLGFGFGEFIELRGVYLQSYDLTTSFKDFGLANYNSGLFNPQDVTLTRYGGEFKANIGTRGLKPYITLGTGIQDIEIPDKDKYEQIYVSAGLGLKFNLLPRVVFLLEGKNTTYNFNAGAKLLSTADKTNFGVGDADFSRERLSNWSVQGALQFYLGGRKPGTMTDLDQAYLKKFRGGLRGIQPIIEPGIGYIAFNGESMFRDTWLIGGYAGIDINDYIGIRGFYFQASENKELSTNFDDLSLYGLEFRARLNDGNGVTPYLTLGGGYLNPTNGYLGKEGASVKAGEFATGGLGLNIPLGKRVVVSGGARVMLTSTESPIDVSTPDEIQTHFMYNAGIKFILGKKSNSPQTIYQENLNRDVESRMADNNLKVQQMKKEYQDRIAALEEELALAYETKDVDKAVELLVNKQEAEKSLKEVEKLENVQKVTIAEKKMEKPAILPVIIPEKSATVPSITPPIKGVPATNIIQMSPAEFESIVVNILEAVREKPEIKTMSDLRIPAIDQQNRAQTESDLKTPAVTQQKKQQIESDLKTPAFTQQNKQQIESDLKTPAVTQQNKQQIELMNQRIELLEKLLFDINSRLGVGQQIVVPSSNDQVNRDQLRELSKDVLKELDKLERKVDKNADQIDDQKASAQTVVVTPIEKKDETDAYITSLDEEGNVLSNQKVTEIGPDSVSTLKYKNSSAMFGLNFGGVTTANIGARLYYDINKLPLEFMPEIYIGLGRSISFGVSGNVIYNLPLKGEKLLPYVGLGLGFGIVNSDFRGNYNIIMGLKLPFITENLSFDYTMRNTFDYNQFAFTYKLPF